MIFSEQQRPMTIRRRAVVAGQPRGDFADAFSIRASIRPQQGAKIVEAGLVESGSTLIVRVRDCANARSITIGDRVRFAGEADGTQPWSIETIGPPMRLEAYIEMVLNQKIGG